MRYLLWVAVLALAACGDDISPEEQAREDAQDVAEVRAAQVPPAIPVTLEPLSPADIEEHRLVGIGCSFLAGESGEDALAIMLGEAAYVRQGGMVVRLAPDTGSGEAPFGTYTRYDGREFGLQLDLLKSEGEQVGMETMAYAARMTLTDGNDRVVYRADGTARCGA